MKILLISTPTRTFLPNTVPPLGILILAACLEQNGHTVKVLDEALLREDHACIISQIREFEPELVGIGGIVTAYTYIIALTGAIRSAFPDLRIVLGGQVTAANEANCFQHMPIDFLIQGYGEIALQKLVQHLEGSRDLTDIPGLSFRRDGKIVANQGREFIKNLNDLPFPAYHHIDMDYYATADGENGILTTYLAKTGKRVESHRALFILGSWGCTDKCTFCIHEQEYVGIRYFSEDYLRRHIQLLHDTYNIRVLLIGEEMFLVNPAQVAKFNAMMKATFPDMYFGATTRAGIISESLLNELLTGNCFSLAFGFESGNQRVLDLMKKGIKIDANLQAIRLCQKTPISVTPSFIMGNVGEDLDSVEDTLKMVRQLELVETGAFFATPYPGSRIWDWAVEQKIIPDTHAYLTDISNRDATVFSLNLTPYPDFVVKMFVRFFVCTVNRTKLKKKLAKTAKERVLFAIKSVIPNRFIPLPLFVWMALFRIYFAFLKLRRSWYQTDRDRKYQYAIDHTGALLPKTLRQGKISTRVAIS